MNGNGAPAYIADKFNMKLLTKPRIGKSGVFVYFLGHHYNGKFECYDVCAAKMSTRPVQVTRRHHKTKEDALVTWNELNEKLKKMEEAKHEAEDKKIVIAKS